MTNTEYQKIRDVLLRVSDQLHVTGDELNSITKREIIDPRGIVSVCVILQNLLNGLSRTIPFTTEKALEYAFDKDKRNEIAIEELVNDIFKSSGIQLNDEESSDSPFDKFMEEDEEDEGYNE